MLKKADQHAVARLAAIVDSSYDAIVSKDLNSVITTWNPAAERLFGYTADEAVGRSIMMLIPDHLHTEEADIISRIRRGESVASYETVRRRKDGSMVPVSLTVSPIRNRRGTIVGASKIARDITATKESERRIRLLMREVNHRVKNQFAVILSMIRETTKRSSDPEQVEAQIRDRIMALSRSHDLLVNSNWAGTGLRELVGEHLSPFGGEKGVEISGPDVTLHASAVQHLGIAFHELATNSAKYGALSSGGTLAIHWSVGPGEDGERRLRLVWEERSPAETVADGNGKRTGFGTVVLQRVTPQALGGAAELTREPGLFRWSIDAPLESVMLVGPDEVSSSPHVSTGG